MNNSIEPVRAKLVALERSNRQLQRMVFVLSLAVAAVFLISATKSSYPLDVRFRHVEAEDIVVRNASGTQFKIWRHDGVPDGVAVDLTTKDATGTHIVGRFAAFGGSGQLAVSASDTSQSITLMPDDAAQLLQPAGGKGLGIVIHGKAPFVSLADSKNYAAILGASRLSVPNDTQIDTTAATLHLFDQNGKISWRAP